MNYTKLKGTITAIITPFKNDRSIDFDAFEKLIEWQIKSGVSGIVVCGSTGEAHTLTDLEYQALIDKCLSVVNNRIIVIAGTGLNSTQKTIDLTKMASNLGVKISMIVAPYYNKPNQHGIYTHFKAVNESSDMKLIAYNVPSRTSIDIEDETMVRITELENVIGVKDATSNMQRVQNLRHLCKKDIILLSGDDSTSLAFNMYGGNGCISVISNLIPEEFVKMQNYSLSNNFTEAIKQNDLLFNLIKVISSIDSNPIPIKYALSIAKKYILDNTRLPLTELNNSKKILIQNALEAFHKATI